MYGWITAAATHAPPLPFIPSPHVFLGKKRAAQVWGFETLTSERRQLHQHQQQQGKDKESNGNYNNKDNNTNSVVYRKRGRVFPEVGCALDNLSL